MTAAGISMIMDAIAFGDATYVIANGSYTIN